MEIDIFPLPSTKGVHRYIGASFLGLIIITYIVGAYKVAQQLIGEDKELLCFLAAIPMFIGGYAVFILLLHCIKQFLYAYFKRNRKELNNRAEQENMDAYIVKHLEDIQKKLDREQTIENAQCNVAPSIQHVQQGAQKSEAADDLQPKIMPELQDAIKAAQRDLTQFMQQLSIDRIQLTEAKAKRDKEKLENILRYTRLVFLPHGFSDEELYQIEEAVKLLVQCNGIVNCVSVKIEKNKLKQADLKNFAWNIGNQYNIDSEVLALFVLSLFHSWFKNTEKETIRKTLRNTAGTYTIEIDANIIEHLPKLEEKVFGKTHK
ncbi:hypothetical protein [Segatella buccae]|uniref:hypothetical protein n=1 Tax=Segatella buccae TaxID=28126 RepID=UPI0022E71074|nr:hypothetical protein [Segatella buccae]